MVDDITALKIKYNTVLQREKKAENILNDPVISNTQKDKWMPEYFKLLNELSILLDNIGCYSNQEAIEGFKIMADGSVNEVLALFGKRPA